MRIPKTPPNMAEILKAIGADPDRLFAISRMVTSPYVSGKYLHWDKLAYYSPPGDLSHQEWWFGLKLKRDGQEIPLRDKAGEPFHFTLSGTLQKSLREIDLYGGGPPHALAPVNKDVQNRYLVRSLIEEAFTSSQLEGAASTRIIAKELARGEREPMDRGERMILNNYRTMLHILKIKNEPLTKELIFDIQRWITEEALDDPSGVGRFRRPDERIAVHDAYGSILHEPPRASELDERMEALCAFANDGGDGEAAFFIHPVIRSMILHFQLAYDHPFVDGNGRTARALFYWSMLKHGYGLFEFVSISQAILKSATQYGRAFLETETDGNDLTYFLIYHAQVVNRAIRDLNQYIERRTAELQALEAELRGLTHLNNRQRDLVFHAIRHPDYEYTVESHRASHNVSRATADNDLRELVKLGLLRESRRDRAKRLTAAPDLERRLRG